ncbi:MAG: aminodeoxychorismate lyase [Colwellia sp.]|nr:aminodeoxychorismate lyase [Colwellia sp.]
MKYCSVNGIEQTSIDITDRGLAYGDGLFTTAKILDGQVILLDKHIQRLSLGCKQLRLDTRLLNGLDNQLLSVAKLFTRAVLKVMITTGSGGRGYSRLGLNADDANIVIIVSDYPTHYEALAVQGIVLGDSKQKIGLTPMLAGLKHLNRLEQVLLRAELDERGEDDLVVINCQDQVVEATCANLFYWNEGQLCTPDLSLSGVNGIIRQEILNQYPQTHLCQTNLADLGQADEIFICNSLMGIMPIKTYNNRLLAINETLLIQEQMKGLI